MSLREAAPKPRSQTRRPNYPAVLACGAMLLLAACSRVNDQGAEVEETGDSGVDGDAAPDAPCVYDPAAWVGSYTLQFESFAFGPPPPEEPEAYPDTPASDGAMARLDLRQGPAGLESTLSMPWRAPVSMTLEQDGCDMRLTGNVVVADIPCSHGEEEETWFGFSLPIAPNGGVGTTFRAWGQGPGRVDDPWATSAFWRAAMEMTATGAISPDAVKPMFRAKFERCFFHCKGLPWQLIRWTSSEPVGEQEWTEHLTATLASSGTSIPLLLTFDPPSDGAAAWSGLSAVSLGLPSWDGIPGDTLELEVGPGVADPSGNISDDRVESQPMVDLGTPQQVHAFNDGVQDVGLWGDVTTLTGADADLCESEACLRIDPSGEDVYLGMAGLLAVQGASRVRLRYRVLNWTPQVDDLRLEVATEGDGVIRSTEVSSTLNDLGEQPGEQRYVSDWSDLELELPAGLDSETVGFFVGPGSSLDVANSTDTCGYDWEPGNPFTLLVERIEAVP